MKTKDSVLVEPNSKLEFWFRKAPAASFDEMVSSQDALLFSIEKPNVELSEFGDDYPGILAAVFYTFYQQTWVKDGVRCRLGHSDLMVNKGSRSLGAIGEAVQTTDVTRRSVKQRLSHFLGNEHPPINHRKFLRHSSSAPVSPSECKVCFSRRMLQPSRLRPRLPDHDALSRPAPVRSRSRDFALSRLWPVLCRSL